MAFFMLLVENTTKNKNESKQLLKVQPLEFKLTFALEKQSSCAISLINVSDHDHVAFKVNTTLPVNCCVYPNIGLIKPKSTCNLTVIIQAQSSSLDYLRCKDKFLIQSKILPFQTSQDNETPEMFADDSECYVEENTLWVVPVPPVSLADHSQVVNLRNSKVLLLAKLDVLEAEFYSSTPKEEGCTTTQVNVKPISEMSICEFVRVWGWKILFPWSVISVSSLSALLYVLYHRRE